MSSLRGVSNRIVDMGGRQPVECSSTSSTHSDDYQSQGGGKRPTRSTPPPQHQPSPSSPSTEKTEHSGQGTRLPPAASIEDIAGAQALTSNAESTSESRGPIWDQVYQEVCQLPISEVRKQLAARGLARSPQTWAEVGSDEEDESAKLLLATRLAGQKTHKANLPVSPDFIPPNVTPGKSKLYVSHVNKHTGRIEVFFKDRNGYVTSRVPFWKHNPAAKGIARAAKGHGFMRLLKLFVSGRIFFLHPAVAYRIVIGGDVVGHMPAIWQRHVFSPLMADTHQALQAYVNGDRAAFGEYLLTRPKVCRDLTENLKKGPLFERDLVHFLLSRVVKEGDGNAALVPTQMQSACAIVAHFLRNVNLKGGILNYRTPLVRMDIAERLDPSEDEALLDLLKYATQHVSYDDDPEKEANAAAIMTAIVIGGAYRWLKDLDKQNTEHVQHATKVLGLVFSLVAVGIGQIPISAAKDAATGASTVIQDWIKGSLDKKYSGVADLKNVLEAYVERELLLPARSGWLVPGCAGTSRNQFMAMKREPKYKDTLDYQVKIGKIYADAVQELLKSVVA